MTAPVVRDRGGRAFEWRRPVAVLGLALIAAGLVAADRADRAPAAPSFGTAEAPLQPVAPTGDALTTVWFCSGVPADADGSASGSFAVLNPTDTPLDGRVTYTPSEGAPVVAPLQVAARTRSVLTPPMAARFVAAQIEVFGTNGVVDQWTTSKAGTALSPCASSASPTWYVADGTTTADAQFTLLVGNPFPDDAIVDITFATDEGVRTPQELQGYVVPGRSLRLVDVDKTVQRNQLASAAVTARSGRVVVGRYQTFRSLRRGLVAGLASPAAGTTWLFASGEKGNGIAERVVVFNPTPDDAEVDVTITPDDPAAGPVDPISVTVPGRGVNVVDVSATDFVPDGRHTIRVASQDDVPIVVDRVLDRGQVSPTSGRATTSLAGSLLTGGRWFLPASPPAGSAYVVSVANTTGQTLSVVLQSVGPAGPVAVPGFEEVPLPPGGAVHLDAGASRAIGDPLIVEATGPVVVDRLIVPPGSGTGATAALAIVQG